LVIYPSGLVTDLKKNGNTMGHTPAITEFKKAYDSVRRQVLHTISTELGKTTKLVR
jgi:hypothetical protein